MLLYTTGPSSAEETRARRVYSGIAAAWPALAAERRHPRTGLPLRPAVTRFDCFLEAFSPAEEPAPSGLPIRIPPAWQWFRWVPSLRGPLRSLVLSAFPCGLRYAAPFDPSGPRLEEPEAEGTERLRSILDGIRSVEDPPDPAQSAADPRLWLVLAPPLDPALETIFLATFLRAEPFARVARFEGEPEEIPGRLGHEIDALMEGGGLVSEGLVADLDQPEGPLALAEEDEAGGPATRTSLFDLASGLEDLYATHEVLQPGQVYNRLHSNTGSEELYIVIEGEGHIRVNERLLPIRAGQCFGKPRNYGCATQIVNTGATRLVLLDIGTSSPGEVDLCHYPEHGELMARFGGHRWLVPTEAILPAETMFPVYDRRYIRGLAGTRGEGPARSGS